MTPPAGVTLSEVAARLPMLDVSCNRYPRGKLNPEKLLVMTERAIAAAAQLAQAKDVPPNLRMQFETLLSRSLPSVKRRQPVLPASAQSAAPDL